MTAASKDEIKLPIRTALKQDLAKLAPDLREVSAQEWPCEFCSYKASVFRETYDPGPVFPNGYVCCFVSCFWCGAKGPTDPTPAGAVRLWKRRPRPQKTPRLQTTDHRSTNP